jgi:hypothetical protein
MNEEGSSLTEPPRSVHVRTALVVGGAAAVWMLPLLLPELPGPSSSSSLSLSLFLPLPPDEEVVVLAADTVTAGAVVGTWVGWTVGSCVGCQHKGTKEWHDQLAARGERSSDSARGGAITGWGRSRDHLFLHHDSSDPPGHELTALVRGAVTDAVVILASEAVGCLVGTLVGCTNRE